MDRSPGLAITVTTMRSVSARRIARACLCALAFVLHGDSLLADFRQVPISCACYSVSSVVPHSPRFSLPNRMHLAPTPTQHPLAALLRISMLSKPTGE